MRNLKFYLYALRPQQWVKNLILFLPLIFDRKLLVFPENFNTVLAFILFSAAASSVYLVNDVIDAAKDKFHPTKRLRPIASGKLEKKRAFIFAIFLGSISLLLSFYLSMIFGALVLAYLAFNLLYSKLLKSIVIIDVFCLVAFFLIRILAGGVVAQVALSHWIIAMTALLALFLGFNKRRQELQMLQHHADSHRHVLRQYNAYFIDQMVAVITSSLVMAYLLYTVDSRTVSKIGSQNLLLTVPFVYYGIFRYLYLVHKVRRDGDPTRMLLNDRMMQLDVFLWIVVCLAVIYFKFSF